ncbi:response regulator [Paracraurococcus ruber]|uniref:Two-component system response regulator n=1 Tax=Paracraurococcus ruber TaxID=77675 RepID=A0ABS1D5M1_9PROT|nr:response regulator [Paracraurococcus ruber]MBK1662172.1 two-component system response regulator [Paracraurococcus ruber]TDG14600.1 response regulator [Paracraurococcus ruber]
MSAAADAAATCLVVDDSSVVRKAARRIVEKLGFSVREAADGAQALAACRAELPRAVLLDWNMPVMDGITFLRAARAEFGPDRPVVVLCTTEAAMDRIVEALEAGAQEYIMKPFDEALLQDKFVQAGLIPDPAA